MTNAPADHAAREFATDPAHNVVLEASAGTGKTSVLVQRYLRLLRAGVAPANVLAITFTRQAAAEMRARIIEALRRDAAESPAGRERWRELRERLGEVAVSTVDAFCLALLREFPLEADLDPGFGIADETEVPRLADEAVDRTLVVAARLAAQDAAVAMLLARLGPGRTRAALRSLLERRLVVPGALQRFLAGTPSDLTGEGACRAAVRRLADRVSGLRREVELLVEAGGGGDPGAAVLARDLRRLPDLPRADAPAIRAWLERLRDAFLTRQGDARKSFPLDTSAGAAAKRRYRQAAAALAPVVRDVLRTFERDVNVVLARAVRVLFGVVVTEYQRALRARALLDFSDVLQRAVDLLRQMDEFARSRYRLESRYHHVLVDEFQDTSRNQWELVWLLVQSWGEGSGLVADAPLPPTIFVVGDRKQSIYRFRDADVATFREATEEIAGLRAGGDVRRAISHSFRAVPALLGFVNDLFAEIGGGGSGRDRFRFRFDDRDRFPVAQLARGAAAGDAAAGDALGVIAAPDLDACAAAVAAEIAALLGDGRVREKGGAGTRAVRPQDVAILFRTRESHREFEDALRRRGIPTHVYKGMGFFDADEIKDARALVRFLANPSSELRAAALLRSRLVGVSDPGLLALAGALSPALVGPDLPAGAAALGDDDRRVLTLARRGVRDWTRLVDRLPPAEVLDRVLCDAAYAFELRGPQAAQAQANLGKLRALVRRIQNRGYATMARVAKQLDRLSAGMANAVVEAVDAVALMTVHAAKGLEFPIVFLVDLGRGTRNWQPPVRVVADRGDGQPAVAVWPYRDEAADAERERDVEETKRLLYVAATRPRDRLYLSLVVEDGVPKCSPGSFGSVLPASLRALFGQAAAAPAGRRVAWPGRSGARHGLRVCGPASAAPRRAAAEPAGEGGPPPVLLAPLASRPAVERLPVTGAAATRGEGGPAPAASAGRRLGRLFHLLLRRYEGAPAPLEALERASRELAAALEPAEEAEDDVAAAAARRYAQFAAGGRQVPLLGRERLWEVPFALRDPAGPPPGGGPAVVRRGTMDCLVRDADGRITVLEFKTGRPRAEHARQLAVYVAAARAMFPAAAVEGRLVYV